MITDKDLHDYLQRIDLSLSTPDEKYLNQLHLHHVTHIPFETFDLIDRKDLRITRDYIFDRIVRQHRGGVCYQMNGLFHLILTQLNYQVQLISCEVYSERDNTYSRPFSHLSLSLFTSTRERITCVMSDSQEISSHHYIFKLMSFNMQITLSFDCLEQVMDCIIN